MFFGCQKTSFAVDRPMLVVTDQRQTMFFGSQTCFKSVTACYLGALIAWSGLQNNDQVGGLVIGNKTQQEIRPRRSRHSVLKFIHAMLEFNQQLNRDSGVAISSALRLEQSLIELRRIAKPGSAIYIISDFAGLNEGDCSKHLYQLSRHCEITGLFVYDPMEKQLPPPGTYTVTDGQRQQLIHTGGRQARQRYAQHFEQRHNALQQQLAKLGIPLIDIGTEQPPLQRLLHYYGAQNKRPRSQRHA
jgi:uncharacterized protein (DUF58 family)